MSLPETYKLLRAQGKGQPAKIEELPLPQPGANQVLVKIEFAPINPSDVMNIAGLYPVPVPPPRGVGFEGSGTVVAVGTDLKRPAQVGEKVHVIGLGTFGQYVVTASESTFPIKGDLPFEQAACHFVNPGTVVGFGDVVQREGHKAAIHTAGSSALGRMLIRYFKEKGIPLINVVRKDEYIEELKKEGADYVLNSQSPDFETQLKEIAAKVGATACFEAVGGELTGKVLRNQPNGSTLYVYGALAGAAVKDLNVSDFIFQGKTVTGFWLTPYVQKLAKLGEAQKIPEEVSKYLPTILSSNIQKVFKLEEFEEALAYYNEHSSKGKILFRPN